MQTLQTFLVTFLENAWQWYFFRYFGSIICVLYGYFNDFEYNLLYFVNYAAVLQIFYRQKLFCSIFSLYKANDILQV